MPGFVTHYLFGLQTYKELSDDGLRRFIHKHRRAYSLGLQGPDVFFYYFPSYLIHPHNIGNIAHTQKTGAFFANLLNGRSLFAEDAAALEIADAYLMGFLGHYTLDCTVHPFVYAFTHYDPQDPPGAKEYFGQHAYLETELDNDLLWKFLMKKPGSFDMGATIRLSRKERRVIAGLLTYAYQTTWPKLRVTFRQVRQATLWMSTLASLMRDPGGRKKVLVRKAEALFVHHPMVSAMIPSDRLRFASDQLNHNHRKWKHPWTGEISACTFEDLLDEAKAHYIHRLQAYLSLMETSFPEKAAREFLLEYGDNSFSSGLPWQKS